MSVKMSLACVFFICTFLSGCVNVPVNAPCDENASFCGGKTKINHW